jgi:N-methylhydantoinase B
MRDCSVGLFDRWARMLGQSSGLPIFLGNLEEAIRVVVNHVRESNLAEGDVYILNDSYLVGTHLPDISLVTPIFHAGGLVGFTASRAHWRDIGAKDPGSVVDTTEIYQEGLRLGPTCVVRAGVVQADIVDILQRNSRTPGLLHGDLLAQIAAARVGERGLSALIGRYSLETLTQAAAHIFEQCERLDREAIVAIPDGVYRAEGYLDSDGSGSEPVPVRVTVSISGSDMHIDLSGSSPQTRGCINCGRAQTISGCRVAFKMLINPHIPVTGGSFKPLAVQIPDRSLFDAQEPAACQYYFSPLGLLIDLIVKALAPAVPAQVAAAHFGDSMVLDFGRRSPNFFLMAEALAGGWGASAGQDGESALINNVNGGLRNMPVETIEAKFPIRLHSFSLRPDSGGLGRWRGGLGVRREYEVLEDRIFLTLHFERSVTPAWGLSGGSPAQGPCAAIRVNGEWESLPLRVSARPVPRGTVVRVETGGGGGFGPSAHRTLDAIETDVREGYITEGN